MASHQVVSSRLVAYKGTIHKIKTKYDAKYQTDVEQWKPELDGVLRALLFNPLKPLKVQTQHFLVDAVTRPWPVCHKLGFMQNGRDVEVFPNALEMLVTKKMAPPGECKARQSQGSERDGNTSEPSVAEVEAIAANPSATMADKQESLKTQQTDWASKSVSKSADLPTPERIIWTRSRRKHMARETASVRESTRLKARRQAAENRSHHRDDRQRSSSRLRSPGSSRSFQMVRATDSKLAPFDLDLSHNQECQSSTDLVQQSLTIAVPARKKVVASVSDYCLDRAGIQQEELAEEMKLQQLAKTETSPNRKRRQRGKEVDGRSGKEKNPSEKYSSSQRSRKRSFFSSTLEAVLTPVKKLWHRTDN